MAFTDQPKKPEDSLKYGIDEWLFVLALAAAITVAACAAQHVRSIRQNSALAQISNCR